jgi:L-seryl-tRNA(Ser) seleniumtransferase
VVQGLTAPVRVLTQRAERISAALSDAGIDSRPVRSTAAVGGGGAPGVSLDSAAVSLPDEFAPRLRAGHQARRGGLPAVLGRIENGRLLLDLKAVPPGADEQIVAAVIAAAG